MTDPTLMQEMTITVRLSQPEPGVYVAQAHSDDGRATVVESTESIYEASAYAVAQLTASAPLVRS